MGHTWILQQIHLDSAFHPDSAAEQHYCIKSPSHSSSYITLYIIHGDSGIKCRFLALDYRGRSLGGDNHLAKDICGSADRHPGEHLGLGGAVQLKVGHLTSCPTDSVEAPKGVTLKGVIK